jgi:hypothetical protein
MKKLKSDLRVVLDKVKLCREMLPQSPGIATDSALQDVVGFLEACRGRLMELIEAGTMGLLDDDVLELCLRTTDALNKTLEAESVSFLFALFRKLNKYVFSPVGPSSR